MQLAIIAMHCMLRYILARVQKNAPSGSCRMERRLSGEDGCPLCCARDRTLQRNLTGGRSSPETRDKEVVGDRLSKVEQYGRAAPQRISECKGRIKGQHCVHSDRLVGYIRRSQRVAPS